MQNQWYKPVISVSVLAIYMSTAVPWGYVSPSKAAPMLPNALHNYCEDDAVYMRVAALLALNLGSGLFFKAVNIGQSRCLRECLRPFIIANHVIHPRGLCFLTRTGAHARMHTNTHVLYIHVPLCVFPGHGRMVKF